MTSALDFGGKRYLALEVFGMSDAEVTDIVGLRFFNETHPQGIVLDTFSLGGYAALDFLGGHADAGAMFGPSAIGQRFSTMEPYEWAAGALAVQGRHRRGHWRPQSLGELSAVPGHPHRRRLSKSLAKGAAESHQFVRAQLAIAQTDSNVMVIYARRLTDDIGWNSTSGQSGLYLEDGVHYTPLGAKVLSAAVAAAMMGEIHASGRLSDPASAACNPR